MKFKTIIIAIVIFLCVIAIVIGIFSGIGKGKSLRVWRPRDKNEEVQFITKSKAREETLQSRGKILSTHDNTSVEKARIYNKIREKELRAANEIAEDAGDTASDKPEKPDTATQPTDDIQEGSATLREERNTYSEEAIFKRERAPRETRPIEEEESYERAPAIP